MLLSQFNTILLVILDMMVSIPHRIPVIASSSGGVVQIFLIWNEARSYTLKYICLA